MSHLLILRGVPASGKSTYALHCVKEYDYARINRDDIRFTMYGTYWGGNINEDAVTQVEDAMLDAALLAGQDVVLDATNLRNKALKSKLSIAAEHGAVVEFKDFPIALDEAVRRDAARDRSVGAKVITDMMKRYKIDQASGVLKPAPLALPTFERYVPTYGLEPAYIIDTDGTVANHEPHRSPYDTSKYHLDTARTDITAAVRALSSRFKIVGLSGRDEEFRAVTEEWWVKKVGIMPDDFFMRPKGDVRMDAIVKYDLFNEHVAPKYRVLGAFDDRPQVIRMWRTIGVSVFDVGMGREF